MLDNQKNYSKYDQNYVADSIEVLPDQIRQILDESKKINIPNSYTLKTASFDKRITEIVVNGMGGSNLGARIIKSVFNEELIIPLNIEPGYDIPGYVNKNTLYIVSSYSGGTEEPLSVIKAVKNKKGKILAITENSPNNKLIKEMKDNNIPGITFEAKNNPSLQPRLGLGYSVIGLLLLISKTGAFKINEKEIKKIIADMEIRTRELKKEVGTSNNDAKKIALSLFEKNPMLIGSDFIEGNLHALRNQINETAKSICNYLTIPELNHYAMEGLTNPVSVKKNMIFLFFDSELYNKRNQKRMSLTKEVVKKNKIKVIDFKLKADTRLGQAFELLQLGSWISYYLGILYRMDPVKTPYVDWFKKKLK